MEGKNDLERFVEAQRRDFPIALREIERGRKSSHWMWYIFPQLRGLGTSPTSEYYGIDGADEARRYLENDYLRSNLLKISEALLDHKGKDIEDILGGVDAVKLRSCMTLFYRVSGEKVFLDVLEMFHSGKEDAATLRILQFDD